MKICIISEELDFPFDEGIKNFAYNLIKELSRDNNILALSIRGNKTDERYIEKLDVNKTFLSYSLFRKIRCFNPVIVLYVSSSSAGVFSFMRSKILKFYIRRAEIVMITLQPRKYSLLARKIISFLIPDLIAAQSQRVLDQLSKFGCDVKLVSSGVDLEKFQPINNESKADLRKKYEIEQNKFVILHVGHINRNRNIQILKNIQGNNKQVIIVGSTSTEKDKGLVGELRSAGVMVITHYLDNIEKIYQLSDCYVFPCNSENSSIESPLSILEAMACNLPVVSTKFGGLPMMFKEEKGFFYINSLKDVPSVIEKVKSVNQCDTREMVKHFSWENVARKIVDQIT